MFARLFLLFAFSDRRSNNFLVLIILHREIMLCDLFF